MARLVLVGWALSLTLVYPSLALAQGASRGGSTTSGAFGARTLGGGVSNRGTSLFGSSSTRGAGAGVGSSATTAGMDAGTVTGGERFLRGNRNANTFVGADTGEVRNIGSGGAVGAGFGAQGVAGGFNQQFRQFNQFANQFQQFRNFQNFNNLNQPNNRTQVRVGLTLGFPPPALPAAPVSAAVVQRLTNLPGLNLAEPPQVMLEGRTAVVRGTAATEHDRELVSRLLLLEPGISAVRNEMTLAQGTENPGSSTSSRPAVDSPEPPPAPPQS